MKPIIDITFNRLTAPPPEEIQRIYDYVISLGWTEHQCVHSCGSQIKTLYFPKTWNISSETNQYHLNMERL